MSRLVQFAYDVTSQNGEDGMLAHLIGELGVGPDLCVEFGAWDGRHLSNTWTLWAQHGWEAVLIEPDSSRFKLLRKETRGFDDVTILSTRVGTEPGATVDDLLSRVTYKRKFSLLSIDIDGDDYWVWKVMKAMPAIVVIEYNASFAPEVKFVPRPGNHVGSSAASLVELGAEKGYTLVDLTKANLVFVRKELVCRLSVDIKPLEAIFDRGWLPVVYSDMYGLHHIVRPGLWGFGGVRADLKYSRWAGRLRYGIVRATRWASGRGVPGLSHGARILIDRLSRQTWTLPEANGHVTKD